jgi:hypothetical protein
MIPKPWYTSKTIWLNIFWALVATGELYLKKHLEKEDIEVLVFGVTAIGTAVSNGFLRLVTYKPIDLSAVIKKTGESEVFGKKKDTTPVTIATPAEMAINDEFITEVARLKKVYDEEIIAPTKAIAAANKTYNDGLIAAQIKKDATLRVSQLMKT